jgi:predicted naringenin-chalcone synthase
MAPRECQNIFLSGDKGYVNAVYRQPQGIIKGIGTAVPENIIAQADFLESMLQRTDSSRERRYLHSVLADSGINTRHVVLSMANNGALSYRGKSFENASSQMRNEVFCQEVGPLVASATRSALRASGVLAEEITHIVAVSCTGFSNPGFDFDLICELGIPAAVHRYFLGFMGCYGAFPALELATLFCRNDPEARVLCVCAEICSVHFQPHSGFDALLGASLFSDGVAAAVVTGEGGETGDLIIENFHSRVVPDSEGLMAWRIGNQGFDLMLSPYVSRVVGSNILDLLPKSWSLATGAHWIVHPGGKSILDRVESSLDLGNTAILKESRQILRMYGNMSSATVLFVLERFLEEGEVLPDEKLRMVGFGPGLTVKAMELSGV